MTSFKAMIDEYLFDNPAPVETQTNSCLKQLLWLSFLAERQAPIPGRNT